MITQEIKALGERYNASLVETKSKVLREVFDTLNSVADNTVSTLRQKVETLESKMMNTLETSLSKVKLT